MHLKHEATTTIVDVTKEDFDSAVVARSQQTPVLVDIGADCCLPCRVPSPLLERLTRSYDGACLLANVGADGNMRIAGK